MLDYVAHQHTRTRRARPHLALTELAVGAAIAPALAALKVHIAAVVGSRCACALGVMALADFTALALAHVALLMVATPAPRTSTWHSLCELAIFCVLSGSKSRELLTSSRSSRR